LFACKNYISLTCLNVFFAIFNFDNIYIKSIISSWSLFQHANNSKKTKQLLGFQKPRKKSAKTRTLGFLGNGCAYGGGDSRKPTKNQGENQGSRKPSVLVGFLRQKKDCALPLNVADPDHYHLPNSDSVRVRGEGLSIRIRERIILF
jgi:hypothetical protein